MDKFRTFYEENEELVDKTCVTLIGLAGLAAEVATWYVFCKSGLAVKGVILANRLIMGKVLVDSGYLDEASKVLNWLVS